MKTIYEQTGWVRPFPKMICQDISVLESIHDYSYDLDVLEFVEYFKNRTGIVIDEFSMDDLRLPVEYALGYIENSTEFKTVLGEMISFSERYHFLKSHKILRGQIQDCWELFLKIESC